MAKKKPAAAEQPLVPAADAVDELAVFRKQDAIVADLKAKYMGMKIAGVDDRAGFEAVHAARMIVKNARVGVEKTRVALKAGLLDRGRKIDAEAQRVTKLLEPIETYLEDQEDAVVKERERIKAEAEAARKAKIKQRYDALQACDYKGDLTAVPDMPDEHFDRVLTIAREDKAKADRIAAEQRRQAEEREAELAAERKRLDDIAKAQEEELRVLRSQRAPVVAPDPTPFDVTPPNCVSAAAATVTPLDVSEPVEIEHADTVKALVERAGVEIELLTCYDCPLWRGCEFAFDAYNIDGDCLADK